MDNTIDTLQIEIESSTTDAQRGLTKLKNSLQKLTEMSNTVANINSDGISKLKEMAHGVESLANAGNNLGLSVAVSELRKLSKINFSNFGAGSEKISEIANKVGEITNANPIATPSVGNIAYSSQVNIDPSTITDSENALNRTKEALGAIRKKAGEVTDKYRQQAEELVRNSRNIDLLEQKLTGLRGKLAEALSSQGSYNAVGQDTIVNYISKIQKLEAELKKASTTGALFRKILSKIPVFNAIKQKAGEVRDSISSIFYSIDKDGSRSLTKLGVASKIALSPLKTEFKLLGLGVKVILTGVKNLGKYMGGKLKSAVSSVVKKFSGFTRSLGRIAMYRAIRTLLSQIATAFREGTNNVYQYSKAIGGNLASSMDRIASSSLYLKNSIGAMVAPLISALAPAIEYVIDKAVDLINILNQLFAKLSGASTWTKAVKTQTEYAEAAGCAAEATKSLTTSFDELNVLSDNGGGGGAGNMDYGSMFKEMQLDSDFAKRIDQIKKAIVNGNWAGVGKILGDKVNELINKVDFAGIRDKLGYGIQSAFEVLYNFLDTINFDKIGAGIATTLNQMMAQIDFGLVGKTFAKKWTILVDTLYSFITTFDWTKFGLAIADFINGWFEEIDLTKTLQTSQKLIVGIFESMSQVIRNVEWYKIGTQIRDAIESIDWMSLLGNLGALLSDAVAGLLDLLLGVVGETDWSKVVQDICAGIGNMLANIKWNEILAKIDALVIELVVQLPGIIVGALGGIADILGGLFKGFGLDSVAGFFYGIRNAMRSAGTWLKGNLVDPVLNWVKNLFGIHSPSTVFAEIGTFLINGLLQGITDTWHNIVEFFSEKFEGIKQACLDTWNTIKSTAYTVWGNIQSFLSTTWDGINSTASTVWDSIQTTTSTAWDNVKSSLYTVWNSVKSTTNSMFNNIQTSIANVWDNVKTNTITVWGGLKTTLSTTLGNIKSTAVTVFSSMMRNICAVWDNLKLYISNAVSSIAGFMNNMNSIVSSGINAVKGLFDNAVSVARNVIGKVSETLSNIGNSISNAASSAISWVGSKLGFASGGFPEVGQLFIAREAGAEMVGSIGGRTAVANNDQIVEGIYQGVLAAMRASDSNNGGNFDVRVYLDSKQITAAVEKRQRERGATIYPGGVLNGI